MAQQASIGVQIFNLYHRQKKDGSGDYYAIDGSVNEGGVFESFLPKDLASKLEEQKLPANAELVFEPKTYQGQITWRLVDIR